ncbi:unnamed protein product [Candidula unifasciata]|uniref:SWIM-type domain-containing protein n=1 Tax=Candidula unifasciata TaxID=100452 RepID=A0A8S3Z1X4_9EUPU|nr:unnamed protein product [Candidula unifasciata]
MSHQNLDVCVVIEDGDLTDDEPGPSRSVFRPSVCSMEAAWFNQSFQRPSDQVINSDIPQDCLLKFQELIWNSPHDRMVPGYGLTPKELASISSDGRKGWLVTSHFYWLSRTLNQQQLHTRFFVLDPGIRKASVEKLLGGKSVWQVKQVIFVLSVGRQDDGTVFLSTDKMQGDHWSVAVVDVITGRVSYCDTLGWPAPENFLPAVIKYTYILGLPHAGRLSVRMAHKPNSEQHTCTPECTNYPLQTCSDVCGVVAMVCIATAAFDKNLFELLMTPVSKDLNLYLTDPTLYSSYLRHVLIYWLISGNIDISRISLKPGFSPHCPESKPALKRKLENGNSCNSPKRQVRNVPDLRNDVTLNEYILEALETGVSSETLLSEVRTLFAEGQSDSDNTISKYIGNVTFNSAIERSKDDAWSTKSYIKELVSYPKHNPIILFKNIGKEMSTLSQNDAVMAIQTPFQKEMMKIHGRSCICVDTRRVEGDKFCLVTVLVCVEGSLELPVAWLITNRYDAQVLNLFIKTLRINVGELHTEIFLGDTNQKVYKVWIQHFPKPNKTMFNTWEVLQGLTAKVETLVPGVKEQNDIKCHLNILLRVTDIKSFRGYLQAFLDVLKPFEPFLSYFKTRYVEGNKDVFWASCYRCASNMKYIPFLTSHSTVLKELGFSGRHKMNRMDVIMHKLLQLIRFLESKVDVQANQARLERVVTAIEKQHNKPMGSLDIFQSASGEEWYIRASHETNSYSIIESGSASCSCELRCRSCKICVHRYICSCCEYLLLSSSCKHIHMINTYKRMNSVINDASQVTSPSGSPDKAPAEDGKDVEDRDTLRAETQKLLEQMLQAVPNITDAKILQDICTSMGKYMQQQ